LLVNKMGLKDIGTFVMWFTISLVLVYLLLTIFQNPIMNSIIIATTIACVAHKQI